MNTKIVSIIIMLCIIPFPACKKNPIQGLEYDGMIMDDTADSWLQTNVRRIKDKKRVLWFQVVDQIDERITIDAYKNKPDSFEKYPADINKNRWIWILINNRIEIRLIADDDTRDYQNMDRLKAFLSSFDLAGLEKVAGKKMTAKQLKEYVPRLAEIKK